ncbi:hypothetical protein GIB67_026501 [Kingdonia uniflora]|uniref:Uncharacterized protein n=1 Tax=Kingdonia uniflora TaxID=39325 RepID=A0A7J7PCE5_9MAGN|nr:hypothetical protein GIB67_026501 [Kingdonia uniflora]
MGKQEVRETLMRFFSKLLCTDEPTTSDLILQNIQPRISEEENLRFLKWSTPEEIEHTMQQFYLLKAPCPDRLSGFLHAVDHKIKDIFEPFLEKVQTRLDGWKAKCLTQVGGWSLSIRLFLQSQITLM